MNYLIFGSFLSNLADTMTEYASMGIDQLLESTVYKWLYYAVCGLCKLVHYLDQMFQVFSGQDKVTYDGRSTFLVNVFFENNTVSNIYKGMMIIGIVLAFTVAMVAVGRKMFDDRDKDQRSVGQILGSLAKSLLLIITLNFIMLIVLSFTNLLLKQVNFTFSNADDLGKPASIDFTDEQYAAMGSILNTIGNYSLNPSSSSVYNINSCYNEIRPELNYLNNQGVFDFYYVTTDSSGAEIDTWQSILQEIAFASNLNRELKIDVYHESVSRAIKHAMDVMVNNPGGFKPLSHYERKKIQISENIPMDRYTFLVGTLSAAKNEKFNEKPSMTDGLRGPYYYGDKNIYDATQAMGDFDFSIGNGGYGYLITLLVVIALVWNLTVLIFAIVTRIFMMMVLYLSGPLIFATEPIDDGEKRKQWTIAFTVQAFSVLGTVIAMRVLLLFVPIIIDSRLVLFENSSYLDLIGKTILMIGGFIVAKKASGVITGILANSAGMQSIYQNDDVGDKALMAPLRVLSAAWGVTKSAGSVVGWGVGKISGAGNKGGGSGGSGSQEGGQGSGGGVGSGGAGSGGAGSGGAGSGGSGPGGPLPDNNHS